MENISTPTKEDVIATMQRIKKHIHCTPILSSSSINQILGVEIYLKCENFQKMGAFKMRGATNAILQMTKDQMQKGVATHSSGNFAQALSLSAKNIGIPAFIVMPDNAPKVKKAAVLGYGAEVIDCESTLEAREAMTEKVLERTGASFVHPSNDIHVILGNATAAIEFIAEIPDFDFILSPVGGGGLLAGTALATHYLSPNTVVIAGEPFGADDAFRSLEKGEIMPSVNPKTIADGLRTSLGDKNFPIIQKHVERIIRVEEDMIVKAMRMVWERMKIIIEPSSAVPIAAIMHEPNLFKGKKVGVIVSGGNVDLGNLPF